jgi:NhaA family Na+:H+ antiporter
MVRVWSFLSEYSLLLVIGAALALYWANVAPDNYHAFVHFPLIDDFVIGHLHVDEGGHAGRTLTVLYLIDDVLMALFFALAGKEVWEAVILKGGSLRGRRALTPLIATAGGMAGPAVVYLAGALLIGEFYALSQGWAIPTATDIAFSFLVGRLVFGAGHPAVQFLLLLAIADDAGGLLILALFYPTGEMHPAWLLVSVGAALAAYLLFNLGPRLLDGKDAARPVSTWVRRRLAWWPYVIAGLVSWYAFQEAGVHPALGLLPVIPAIPHADVDFGLFAEVEEGEHDLLNAISHALKTPVEAILFFFGLVNAGVEFSTMGAATWLVAAGLFLGKPVGVTLFGWFAAEKLKLGMPEGMRVDDLPVVGAVAGIGFTVALFVAGVAFPPGEVQDAAKMGALLSFGSALIALALKPVMALRRRAAA